MPFGKLQAGCHVPFTGGVVSVWPLYHKGLIGGVLQMDVLLEGSPISSEELESSVRVTMGFLVTSLTKVLIPRLLSLARAASSRKSLGGSKLV